MLLFIVLAPAMTIAADTWLANKIKKKKLKVIIMLLLYI